MTRPGISVLVACTFAAAAAGAGEADVERVRITKESAGYYRFEVTVRHGDAGSTHYADKWNVVGRDGKILGTRVLLHPHDIEQPFTRALRGVAIPRGVTRVTVRAHDKVHGYGGKVVTVVVPRDGDGS